MLTSNSIIERNSLIHLSMLLCVSYLCISYSFWFLTIPILFHAINDFIHWKFGWTIFNTDTMVVRAYERAHFFLANQTNAGLDLGFNFYEGDLSVQREDAQKAKWKYMLNQLQLKPGDKLIDIGCGYGDWIRYARDQGIQVKGVNITKVQADLAKAKYGLDVINVNWKEILKNASLQKELYGQFDAVTFMDTIEHYVPATARYNDEVQKNIYTDMFRLAHHLINPNSHTGRMFFSCLHQTMKKFSLLERICVWFHNRTLSGFYPIGDHGLTQHSSNYFTELKRIDRTEDYRLTAVLENDHFQTNNNVKITLKGVLMGIKFFLFDPYFIHQLLALPLDHWMRLYGQDRHEKRYDSEKRAKVSFIRLWMVTLEKKPEHA